MAQIGLKNLYAAQITEDANGNETYGSPFRLAKAISADLSVNSSSATLYADDGADVDITEFVNAQITLNVNDISNAHAAQLTGATVDANGVLVSASENQPAAFAIGFQSKSARGGDLYVWLYRVKFAVPNQTLNTKADSIAFATPSIVGTVSRRNKVDANDNHPWKAQVKAGDPGVSAATISGWFGGVYEPSQSADVSLDTLALGSGDLSPAFDPDTLNYTATTTSSSETITATANDNDASVAIIVNGTSYASGDTVTWVAGTDANEIKIIVSNGSVSRTYTVTLTKS